MFDSSQMESFVKYFKKTKERERDEGLALANNSSEENRGRGSSSGGDNEETMREDEDETQVQTIERECEALCASKKRKNAGAASYGSKHALECRHQGRADVIRHINRESYLKKQKMVESSSKMNMFIQGPQSTEMGQLETQTRRAEVKVAMTMVQHNIPLAFSDHLSPLFKECFPDSKIAQKYSSARTKTTAIINKCVAPYFMDELVKNLCDHPFSLATDGSNDTGREKLNPLTVKIWSSQGVIQRFLDMGLTSGTSCGTAEAIFNKRNEVLEGHSIPWANCVALAVDNASVNLGARNSIKSRVLDQNPSIYVLGCPCHIVHNNAHAGGLVYSEMSGFEVEDFCVDLAYWFKSSTKRKNMLHEFCVFCDTTYMEVLQHFTIRWLSLDLAVNRILRVYKALTSYFRSTDDKQARCLRLRALFEDPLTEVHLLFYQALLPTFCQFNLLFQRQHPCIYLLHGQVRAFIRKLMSKFLKPAAFRTTSLESVDLQDQENQLPDTQLGIGLTTKSTLIRLHEAGEIPSGDVTKFNKAARGFLLWSTEYALKKLPLNDPLLPHAEFVDFRQRQNSHVDDVLYFVQRYKHLLPFEDPREQDRISDEFLEYQMLEEKDIPDMVWKGALVSVGEEEQFHRMDMVWAHLTTQKSRVTGKEQFPRLGKEQNADSSGQKAPLIPASAKPDEGLSPALSGWLLITRDTVFFSPGDSEVDRLMAAE
ncbi:hypothetical protein JOQ06_028856 [Pogonophryne albipinna]|uniref:Uncharacterized protein n=1 Tax=Pogonophryne albipinna TaxID=1090488 RepID=A0AAD6B9S1_9TELE|nr:hypothetical protein JOQ06_028856 [Pogonophryne albipinna]